MLGISRGARRGAVRKHVAAGTPTVYAFDSTFDNVLTTHREIETAAIGAFADVFGATPATGTTPQLITQWTTEPTVAGTQVISGPVSFTFNGNWIQGAAAASAAPALRMELYWRSSAGTDFILATFDSPFALTGTYGARTWGGTLPTTTFNEDERLIFRFYLISFGGNAKGGDYVSLDVGAGQGASVTLPGPLNVKAEAAGGAVLFASGFESATTLAGESNASSDVAYRVLNGLDATTGFNWTTPPFGSTARVQLLNRTGTRSSIVACSIGTTVGRTGSNTSAFRLELFQQNSGDSQATFMLNPVATPPQELYIRVWLRQPSDLYNRLANQGGNFCQAAPELKSHTSAGDFRVVNPGEVNGGQIRFRMRVDNIANGGLAAQTFYTNINTTTPVPAGSWYKSEIYFLRHATAGRAWVKCNDVTVNDYTGSTIGVNGNQIQRIFLGLAYADGPIDLWMDDVEIRASPP